MIRVVSSAGYRGKDYIMLPLEDRELLAQTMLGLNVDAATTQSLMASFDAAAEGLESDKISPVPNASFGESHTGGYRLATNAQMAHEAVAQEMLKMAAGMRGMGQSVDDFRKDVEETTDQTVGTARLIEASTECVAAPSFNGGQCTLPTSSEG